MHNKVIYIGIEFVIECQIFFINKCGTKCETEWEITYQHKIRFECVNKCKIYCANECGTECEFESQTGYKAESVTECVIESHIEF